MTEQIVCFIQISDSHIGPTPGYANHGVQSLPNAQRLVDRINALPVKPDFVIHTGDIVSDPDPSAYALAARTFASLRVPVYYVRGNHDSATDIKAFMAMGPKEDLGIDEDRLAYTFETKGYRFLTLDTQGPAESQPQGFLPQEQLDLLRKEIDADGPPLVIFLHHPVLPLDSLWMDANMLIMNGDEVHAALSAAQDRLRGVFYGHIHQSMQTLRDGVLYVTAASSSVQLASWPTDEMVGIAADESLGYNFVRLMPQQTVIRQHRLP